MTVAPSLYPVPMGGRGALLFMSVSQANVGQPNRLRLAGDRVAVAEGDSICGREDERECV